MSRRAADDTDRAILTFFSLVSDAHVSHRATETEQGLDVVGVDFEGLLGVKNGEVEAEIEPL
jgi:hypothetical protein